VLRGPPPLPMVAVDYALPSAREAVRPPFLLQHRPGAVLNQGVIQIPSCWLKGPPWGTCMYERWDILELTNFPLGGGHVLLQVSLCSYMCIEAGVQAYRNVSRRGSYGCKATFKDLLCVWHGMTSSMAHALGR
jgi:hypothetical protein